MTKQEHLDKFIDHYMRESKKCCERCHDIAHMQRAWVERAFNQGWDYSTVERQLLRPNERDLALSIGDLNKNRFG